MTQDTPTAPLTSDAVSEVVARLRDPRMEPFDRDGPLPGMIAAFETHFGQSWTDKDWRNETALWAAAWKASCVNASVDRAVEKSWQRFEAAVAAPAARATLTKDTK